MAITKKDLELLAHAVRTLDISDEAYERYIYRRTQFASDLGLSREEWDKERIAEAIATVCRVSNPRFDTERFMDAAVR